MGTRYVVAVLIAIGLGLVVGWGAPVAAQVVERIYGTTSSGVIVPVLVESDGRIAVVGS